MAKRTVPIPDRRVADLLFDALRAERREYIDNGRPRDFPHERTQDAAWQYVAILREVAALNQPQNRAEGTP